MEGLNHFGKGMISVLPHCKVLRGPRKVDRGDRDTELVFLGCIESQTIGIRWHGLAESAQSKIGRCQSRWFPARRSQSDTRSGVLEMRKRRHVETVRFCIELEWIVAVGWRARTHRSGKLAEEVSHHVLKNASSN